MTLCVSDEASDELNMLFDGHEHVAIDRGAKRARDCEHVRETMNHDTHKAGRVLRPAVIEPLPISPLHVDPAQSTGDGIKPCGQNQIINLVGSSLSSEPGGSDSSKRILKQIHQLDVIGIEGLIVIGIDARPAGSQRITERDETL